MVKVKDTASFIQRAIEVHGDRYDYSQTEWKDSRSPVVIVCRKCGPFVLRDCGSHYSKKKSGCVNCNKHNARPGAGRRLAKPFSQTGIDIYGERYIYDDSKYSGCDEPIEIVCRKHGAFVLDRARSHFTRELRECPKCMYLAEECIKRFGYRRRSRGRKERMARWGRWADVKVSVLSSRPMVLGNGKQKHKGNDWDSWSKAESNRKLRAMETKWQRKCRAWVLGLARRKRHARS